MGRTETALNQFAEAETRFSEAVRLQPANPTYQINLYSIRLQSADRSVAADAHRLLEKLPETNTLEFWPCGPCFAMR
jgi:cytochrome c-type biogenesis protein CcmH/NrfG